MSEEPLRIGLLGTVSVHHGGRECRLPPSKKTRALLAYLVVSGREHRRERLCELLWDVADDPRGALRWSLSKLRGLVDTDGERRIVADRERVRFEPGSAIVDVSALKGAVRDGLANQSDVELEVLAAGCHGEFLEGLELADFMDFEAWCIAEREELRDAQAALFQELVTRHRNTPERAIPHARAWVQLAPLSVDARIALIEALLDAGHASQAKSLYEIARKTLSELGAAGSDELERAFRSRMGRESKEKTAKPDRAPPDRAPPVKAHNKSQVEPERLIGRDRELEALERLLEEAIEQRSQRIAVLRGNPGQGKSHLARQMMARCGQRGGTVFWGKSYEAEGNRPYAPWGEALATVAGESPLAALPGVEGASESDNRERFFASVVDFLSGRFEESDSILLVLDDLQWIDQDSAELLHYVARLNRQRSLMVLLLARGGELADNAHASRVLRSLRREADVQEFELSRLSERDIAALVEPHIGNGSPSDIYRASGGNPLYAIELARAASCGLSAEHHSVSGVVRDRVERLPGYAPELLRWSSVLGHHVDLVTLEGLSSQPLEELIEGLEVLESHGLLQLDSSEGVRYRFSHDLVREAVYSQLSHPRRCLMHRRIASLLREQPQDPELWIRIAHHACLAGDASAAVEACIEAGRYLLRMFANAEAQNVARRGLHHAASLAEPARTTGTIKLLQVRYAASTLTWNDELEQELLQLAGKALDFGEAQSASLGFHLIAYLRWERGHISEAHDRMMDAERASRSTTGAQRAGFLAEAARCLVLVERDLGQAEAFALEAKALAERTKTCPPIPRALGMLDAHRGKRDAARDAFDESRRLATMEGDRVAEFLALEERTMLDIDDGNFEEAISNARAMRHLAEKIRGGCEGPSARLLEALSLWAGGQHGADTLLAQAVEDMKVADSKYRLAYALTREAEIRLQRGELDAARERATEAQGFAEVVSRSSELALAHLVLLEVARAQGAEEQLRAHCAALESLSQRDLAARVRTRMEAVMAAPPCAP